MIMIMLLVGFLISFQAPINNRLRQGVDSPVGAAAMSFLVGVTALMLFLLVQQGLGAGINWAGLGSVPWWGFTGGLLGAMFVLVAILAIPHIGATLTIAAGMLGTIIGAIVVDTLGWFGVTRLPLNWWRLAGAGLILLGILLAQKK